MAKKLANQVVPAELIPALANLAEEAVPLAEWIKGPHKDFQPNETVPWRPSAGSPDLSTRQLQHL